MLETPLYGRFYGEGRRLIFAAAQIYINLIRACVGAGGFCLAVWFLSTLGVDVPIFSFWWALTGGMLIAAGVLASLSLQFIAFDLREKTYRRRYGPGMFPQTTRGSASSLDAVVLTAQPLMLGGGVTYRLVLHWKNGAETPMILTQDHRSLPPGAPINSAAATLHAFGEKVAQAIGVRFFDNSHFPS